MHPCPGLRGQYLHLGAQATCRTTGRGVQMQNLPRLHGDGDPVDQAVIWENATIARNLRQCFRAQAEHGRLVVGDFSSVESRGLAWLSGSQWKLAEYAAGSDMYKVLAGRFYHKEVGLVTKEEFATRSSTGDFAFGPPGANETLIREAGFELVQVDDVTNNETEISRRWHDARQRRAPDLIQLEGEETFEGLQRFLATVHRLTSERRLSRFAYIGRKPAM